MRLAGCATKSSTIKVSMVKCIVKIVRENDSDDVEIKGLKNLAL